MAALQPAVGGLPAPDFSQKTFAAAVLSSPLHAQPSSASAHVNPSDEHGIHGTHKGFPSIAFTDSSMTDLSKPFSWALIGKFSHGYNKQDPKLGRPSVEDLQKYFVSMDFKGSFQLGLLDNRHLLIQFQLEIDYLRLYSRMVWYIRGISMRIFKWSPFFRVDKESSIVPIWITFPRLPIQFFHKTALFPIARLLGHPLRLDDATLKLKRPSVARVQIEFDVLLDKPDKIWIQMGSTEGYWQPVEYENVPPYCRHCWHLGHAEDLCHVHHPDLKPSAKPPHPEPPKQQWKPIQVPPLDDVPLPPPKADHGPSQQGVASIVNPNAPVATITIQPVADGSIATATVAPVTVPTSAHADHDTVAHADHVFSHLDAELFPKQPPLGAAVSVSPDVGFSQQAIVQVPDSDTDADASLLAATFSMVPYSMHPARDDTCVPHPVSIPERKFSSASKPLGSHDPGRDVVFQELRQFNQHLQFLFGPDQPTVSRRRGRPRKTFFNHPKVIPPMLMVTRSSKSLQPVSND